jgi:hypothetical protein
MGTKKRKTTLRLYSGAEVTVYEGAKLQAALEEVTADLTLYKGVKLAQIFEAIYKQGKKDGARSAFEEVSKGIAAAQKQIPHRAPGRPRNHRA